MIFGNTTKIRNYDLDILNSQIGISFPDTDFVPMSLVETMKDFCIKYSTSLGVLVSKNTISAFIIGNLTTDLSQCEISSYESSIFYIKFGTQQSKFAFEIDLMHAIKLQAIVIAYLGQSFLGATAFINTPDTPQTIKIQTVEYINKYGIQQAIQENAVFFARQKSSAYSTADFEDKAILVGVGRRNSEIDDSLAELKLLCQTASIAPIATFSQTRKFPDKHYYIGVGKLDELKMLITSNGANLVVLDDEVTGGTRQTLEDELGVRVIDRPTLILDIFASHATSAEGKLQASLAQMKYNYSRLSALQISQDRYGGGVGMRGPGETKLELAKRTVKNKIYQTEREIQKLKSQRELRRQNRKVNKEKVVALVGYTNAGKSTLLNKLTKSNVLSQDKLFATLDTTTRELYLAPNKKVLLTDTVGFINKLPHEFIDAFSSTLEESLQADLLLIVVDNSSPFAQSQYDVVENVLTRLKANNIAKIVVANKSDNLETLSFSTSADYILTSASTGKNLDTLKTKILQTLF